MIKTEDIPNIENSEFDPQVVTDIAKNILSFLKTNATKEGHTYWLYKGQYLEVMSKPVFVSSDKSKHKIIYVSIELLV